MNYESVPPTDQDYSEINSSQETIVRQSEPDPESAPMDQSDKSDTDKRNQQPNQNLPGNKEPTKKTHTRTHTRIPWWNHGKENKMKNKNNRKVYRPHGIRNNQKKEKTSKNIRNENRKPKQRTENEDHSIGRSIDNRKNQNTKGGRKEQEKYPNNQTTTRENQPNQREQQKRNEERGKKHQKQIRELNEKIEELQQECTTWKKKAEDAEEENNRLLQIIQEITNEQTPRTIAIMDSKGQRMMTHLQNQIPNIEYQPTYTTEELKDTAHNLQDLTKKDTVLIMIGTNDARRHIPHQQAAENIRESINTIRTNNPEVRITIIQPPPIATTDLTATYSMVRYTDNLESIALEQQVTFIRTEETIAMGSDAMDRDGYHLNEEGSTTHANTIIENLQAQEMDTTENNTTLDTSQDTTNNEENTENEDHIEVITTSRDLIGHIIGKKGTKNQQIEDQNQVTIKITHQDEENKATIIITGKQENATKARKTITSTLSKIDQEKREWNEKHSNDHRINCKYHQRGNCKFGDTCRYHHQEPTTTEKRTISITATHTDRSRPTHRDHGNRESRDDRNRSRYSDDRRSRSSHRNDRRSRSTHRDQEQHRRTPPPERRYTATYRNQQPPTQYRHRRTPSPYRRTPPTQRRTPPPFRPRTPPSPPTQKANTEGHHQTTGPTDSRGDRRRTPKNPQKNPPTNQ